METSTDPATPEPFINLDLISEHNDGNLVENDFHFSYLTVESSTDPPRRYGYRHFEINDESNEHRNNFEGNLVNVGEWNVQNNDFEEASNLVFYEKIPSLQRMTSSQVAIALWRRVISLDHSKRKATSYPTFEFVHIEDQNEVCELIQSLPVPRLIRELIEICLDLVKSEINEWVRYFVQNIFKTKPSAQDYPIEMSDLMFCHWLPNSTIDHRKTALNMLSNPRLSRTDKFKIMCKYCFEDEIMQLPAKSIPERFVKTITFDKSPLIYYWLCHMNGNLHKLPRKNGESVECFLITGFSVDTWSAIEYFWNRLSFNEQVSKASVLLNRKPQFQKQLFSKMNEFQKCHVLSTVPFEVTMNFWRQKSHERFAYLTWLRIKDAITYEQFTKFIYALLTESLPDHVERVRYLVKIWNSSSNDFINRALNSMRNTVIGLHAKYYTDSSCDLEFLLTFLSYGSAEFRKAVMLEQGSSLVLYNDFPMIDQLIELCLPDPKDVIEFKNILLKSENVRRHCCSMLDGYDGNLKQLIRFLDHFCPDSSAKTEFLNRILDTWTIDGYIIYSLKRWNEVIEFIDLHILDTFPDQGIKFKKRIAWSFIHYCAECWSGSSSEERGKFMDVVDGIYDTEHLNKFKTFIIETLSARYRWCEFDEVNIHSLLSWCFNNDDQKIKEYKKSFPIDHVFACRLEAMKWYTGFNGGLNKYQEIGDIFVPLDKILLWYFESVDEVKRYKLEKVFEYGDGENRMFIRYENRIDEKYTRMLLPWFFDGDEEQIRKFKEKYRYDVICNLIDVE